ncbi:hypothetical protein [Ottowia thiooxydans]|uniref:hypothetical protein n=1 Tax=Ottowia thiooxydans TaxID=219182 RepID=UPI0012EC3171|nr:hypothetical protein [Ottowia thiooxydans]
MKQLRYLARLLVIAMMLIGSAHGQYGYPLGLTLTQKSADNRNSYGPYGYPLQLHPQVTAGPMPTAIYSNIKIDNFRKLVIGAFEDANFSLVSITKAKDEETYYKFSYSVPVGKNNHSTEMVVRVDENLDKNKKCARCFLRQVSLPEFSALTDLPWMAQYELSSSIYPAIDQAFATIRVNGQAYMDKGYVFNYKNRWHGERNLYNNSFVGIELSALKAAVINSYRTAGFIFVGEQEKDSSVNVLELSFSFPINPDQGGGAVYKVILANQIDLNRACYPCEMQESYDPYQQLPAAGLSGMSNRLTLEARFAAARTLAFEKLKSATERYLRPRSVFVVPTKPAPLGSPRPSPVPVVVT